MLWASNAINANDVPPTERQLRKYNSTNHSTIDDNDTPAKSSAVTKYY
jgi:hypothetical protein